MNIAQYPLVPGALVAAIALLPFGRMVEIPMGLLALVGFVLLIQKPRGQLPLLPTLLLAYLAFAGPMLLALPDAVESGKSLRSTVGSVRFGLSAFAMLLLLSLAADAAQTQARALRFIGMAVLILTTLWCLDGLWQFLTGKNVLGYGRGEGYVNGVFGYDDNIKLGLTVALLMPAATLYALRRYNAVVGAAVMLLLLVVVLLSGKRGAWITAGVELVTVAAYYLLRGQLHWRRAGAIAAASTLVITVAFMASDWVQERSTVLVDALEEPDYQSVNRATGKRLPIWATALRMGQDNWVNGVGARGFRFAYAEYAAEGDQWAESLGRNRGARASHAHQLMLDLWCETGIIGVAGYLLLVAILVRAWVRATTPARSRALPFAAALVGMLFPVNTHPAFYSSWSSLLLWMFIGLFLYALFDAPEAGGDTASSVAVRAVRQGGAVS